MHLLPENCILVFNPRGKAMRKQIIFNVTESDHYAIKLEAIRLKKTIREYIMELVRDDLNNKRIKQ